MKRTVKSYEKNIDKSSGSGGGYYVRVLSHNSGYALYNSQFYAMIPDPAGIPWNGPPGPDPAGIRLYGTMVEYFDILIF